MAPQASDGGEAEQGLLASEGTRLLLAVAGGVPGAADEYDALLFELLVAHVRRRGHLLVADASRLTGTDQMGVPFVDAPDLDEVAHDVAVHALARARRTAYQFQPGRGDGASWAFRAASYSYVDIVRERAGSRRRLKQIPTDRDELVDACDAVQQEQDPAVRYETQEALDRALAALDPTEAKALLLRKRYGYSYPEIAQLLYGDAGAAAEADRVVHGALRKLRKADRRFRAAHQDG